MRDRIYIEEDIKKGTISTQSIIIELLLDIRGLLIEEL